MEIFYLIFLYLSYDLLFNIFYVYERSHNSILNFTAKSIKVAETKSMAANNQTDKTIKIIEEV